ncbi:uncharacterized protein PG986_014372 [Apiospora aurea]|uniref:Uncharacterized protein n=1 Tax=Apiospora aurea TaxID=335848 RepID=A0ABR1PSS8_9PEZI
MIDGHDISLFSAAPFGVFTASTQDAKTRRQFCACAVNLSDENSMLHSIVSELSTSLVKMQTILFALGKETTSVGRAAPLTARAESPSFDDARSARTAVKPVAPPISPLMVLAESAVMDSCERSNDKREASHALYGEDKRQRYAPLQHLEIPTS